jgi:hypothetical protein
LRWQIPSLLILSATKTETPPRKGVLEADQTEKSRKAAMTASGPILLKNSSRLSQRGFAGGHRPSPEAREKLKRQVRRRTLSASSATVS